MTMNAFWLCFMGFFMGRMLVKQDLSQFLLGAMTVFTIGFAFFLTKSRWGAKKAWVMVAITVFAMVLGIGVTAVSRKIAHVYHTDPAFHAKVNAYVFMDPLWQSRLDPYWFQKQRIRIAQNEDHLQELRQLCTWNFTEVARTFNMRVDAYNQAVAGSMVGSQYAEPVKQLLVQRFNDQVAPCGDEVSPHWSPYRTRRF